MGPLRLAGLAEVAELLGVTKRSASRYARRHDFPGTVARLTAGPIWDADEVLAWAAARSIFAGSQGSRSGRVSRGTATARSGSASARIAGRHSKSAANR